MKNKLRKGGWWLLLLLFPVFLWSLAGGSSGVGLRELWSLFAGTATDAEHIRHVIFDLRLPLTVQAFLCGGGLAFAGAVLQAVLRNPLAEPYVLGVSSGSAFGLVAGASAGFAGAFHSRLFFSAAGGAAVTLLVFAGARRGRNGSATVHLILAGVIVNALFSALTMLLQSLFSPVEFKSSVALLMGRFSLMPWDGIVLGGAVVLLLCLFLWLRYSPELDLMLLGEDQAAVMGVAVGSVRTVAVSCTALITAVSVALCGVVGFVGLVAPHAVRFLLGARSSRLLPAVFAVGGGFMVMADTLSRTLLPGTQLPVGAVTALLGAPFFLAVLWRWGGVRRD